MPYINRVKKQNGKYYLYLCKDGRVNGKKVHLYQKYLGPEDRINEMDLVSKLKKNAGSVECETIEFGISGALWKVAQEINLAGLIDEVAGKSRQQGLSLGDYITIAAINRCADPCSKSRLEGWFTRDWLSTRYNVEPKVLNAQTYYNHFQYLSRDKIRDIEENIIKAVVEKYKLGIESVLYDPTNFFTYSRGGRGWKDGKGSDLLMFGNSKQNMNGNRLVAFWLLCERNTGVPLMHETYPGSRQDAGVFRGLLNEDEGGKGDNGEMIENVPMLVAGRLKSLGCNMKRVTMVFDKGNLSDDGMKAIDDENLGFIASRRPSTHKDLLHVPMDKFTGTTLPTTGKKVKFYKTTRKIYGEMRTVYVTFDPAKHRKEVTKFNIKLDEKIAEITGYFKDRASFPRGKTRRGMGEKWRERAEVEKKVKTMIGRNPFKDVLVATVEGPAERIPVARGGRFHVHVKVNANARAKHEETLGRAVLFTNRKSWSPELVIWCYREQYIVEHAFRQMKSPESISLRPMYHHADPCIRAHVFTCVLGHLLLSLLRLKLKQKKTPAGYVKILESLRQVRITKIFPSATSPPILKVDRVKDFAANLVKILGLKRLATF